MLANFKPLPAKKDFLPDKIIHMSLVIEILHIDWPIFKAIV